MVPLCAECLGESPLSLWESLLRQATAASFPISIHANHVVSVLTCALPTGTRAHPTRLVLRQESCRSLQYAGSQ